MARKRPQALFEVYKTFKGIGQSDPATGDKLPPRVEQVPRAAVSELSDRYAVHLTSGQVFAAVVLIVLVLPVALYAGYTIGYGRLQLLDRHLPTSEDVRRGPARPEVLSATGSAAIGKDPFVYDPNAELAEHVSQREQQGPGEDGVSPALGGDFRVRIMSLPVNHRDTQESLQQSRSFLAEQGIATVVENRGRSYYLYSKQTFPSDTHEQAIALRDRIRQLGDQYARRVNRTNEFRSAYIVKRQ